MAAVVKTLKKKAQNFLTTHDAGVLSLITPDYGPYSAYMYYVADDGFAIYFTTPRNSKKFAYIEHNNSVAFNVSSENPPITMQIEGRAEIVKDHDLTRWFIEKYIVLLLHHGRYTPPIAKLNLKQGIVVYRINPERLKWSNYAKEKNGSIEEVFLSGQSL